MTDKKKKALHEEQDIEKSFDLAIMKKLSLFTKPYIGLLILCAVMLLAATTVDLIRPYLIKVIIDDHINGHEQAWHIMAQKPPEEVVSTTFAGNDYVRDDIYKTFLKKHPQYNASADTLAQLVEIKGDDFILPGYDIKRKSNMTLIEAREAKAIPLTAEDMSLFRKMDKEGIKNISLLFLVLLIVGLVITYLQMLLLNYVGQRLVYDMREHLFDHLLKLPLSFYDKNPVGRLVTRVTNDMKNISDMYTDVLVNFLNDVILLIGTLIIMLSLNWKLALIAISTFPLVVLASYLFRIKAREAHREVKAKIARINSVLSENISGMRIVQLFNKEKEVFAEFDEINSDHLASSLREVKVFGIFRPSMNLLYTLALTLLIWFSSGRVLSGVLELGVLFAFINYTDQFFRPIFDLSEKFNILQSAMASSERIFMLLEENVHEEEGPETIEKDMIEGHIDFEGVSFEYLPGEPVLRDINLSIKAGETIAIVGATGSGKTTIISLISRLYDLKQGTIKIDGKDIKTFSLHSLRQLIGVVLQDVFLFAGNIEENISLGRETISRADSIRVAEQVNAHNFIEKLPEGYNETVYERGSTLSTGQRQLLSFARALAYDPKILILDEATSSVDTETEHLIQDAISKLTQNRTTIIIAHRLSTIQNADKIVVMHKGKIRETGTHNELLAHQGLYYDLYLLQYQDLA